MKSIKGPAIFLAQFVGDEAPFNTFDSICGWAASLGYKGVQIPSWDGRFLDLAKAAESADYCDEVKGTVERHGLQITELSTHLQGQLVAVHPAYDEGFDAFAAPQVRGNPAALRPGRLLFDAHRLHAPDSATAGRVQIHLCQRHRGAATAGRPA